MIVTGLYLLVYKAAVKQINYSILRHVPDSKSAVNPISLQIYNQICHSLKQF